MRQRKNIKYYAPILFFFLMLIDGQLTLAIETWTDNTYFASVHLMLLGFMMAVPSLSKRQLLLTALVLGWICDSYYVGILGVYTVALTGTVLLMITFQNVVEANMMTAFFGLIIFSTSYELISVILQLVFHLSEVSFLLFITRVLGPTLLFNMLIFVIFSYPFKLMFTAKS